MHQQPIQIAGAGLAGCLLAILLARQGRRVRVFEKRADPRLGRGDSGRSINLALAARGLAALDAAGLLPVVRPLLMPMRGRVVHALGQPLQTLAYGQTAQEVIYSVSRAGLNCALLDATAAYDCIEVRFEQALTSVAPATNTLWLRDQANNLDYEAPLATTIATDGAGSAARLSLEAGGWLESREDLLDHGYKELTIPPRNAAFALDPTGLHIWPREDFMLIALPNPDRSFTATLFLPVRGPAASFEALAVGSAAPREFFAREFPDALALMPDFAAEFAAHTRGLLGTVRAGCWHIGGQILLLGDAAHAIVPFHGQGMNCAFEDCLSLARLVAADRDWAAVFAAFENERRPQAEAIARMALENYREMRDDVVDPQYLSRRALSRALERAFPGRIVPRYSMVMFHPEIPYATAERRGAALIAAVDELRHAGFSVAGDDSPLPPAAASHAAVQALLARLPSL
jgi:kynurenine 3-monooxygenase